MGVYPPNGPAKLLVSKGGVDVIFIATVDDAKFVFVHDPFGDKTICTARRDDYKHWLQTDKKGIPPILTSGLPIECERVGSVVVQRVKRGANHMLRDKDVVHQCQI